MSSAYLMTSKIGFKRKDAKAQREGLIPIFLLSVISMCSVLKLFSLQELMIGNGCFNSLFSFSMSAFPENTIVFPFA
jgi:hypothetical protein